jgi:hypothetical protein
MPAAWLSGAVIVMAEPGTRSGTTPQLTHDDRHLVDLVSAALVDANLHTDLRMRLQRELSGLLHDTRRQMSSKPIPAAPERAVADHEHHPVDLLTSVLVDPNLHPGLRMRLARELRGLLDSTRPAEAGADIDYRRKDQP